VKKLLLILPALFAGIASVIWTPEYGVDNPPGLKLLFSAIDFAADFVPVLAATLLLYGAFLLLRHLTRQAALSCVIIVAVAAGLFVWLDLGWDHYCDGCGMRWNPDKRTCEPEGATGG
jgi:hypothetical protein